MAIINYDYRCSPDSLLCIGGKDGKEGGCLEGVQGGGHGGHDVADTSKGGKWVLSKITIPYLN